MNHDIFRLSEFTHKTPGNSLCFSVRVSKFYSNSKARTLSLYLTFRKNGGAQRVICYFEDLSLCTFQRISTNKNSLLRVDFTDETISFVFTGITKGTITANSYSIDFHENENSYPRRLRESCRKV